MFDPVTHFEIFPPFQNAFAMLPNVRNGWNDANNGIWGHGLMGLTTDPNVNINHNHSMKLTGMDEHGAYWSDENVRNDLSTDLR